MCNHLFIITLRLSLFSNGVTRDLEAAVSIKAVEDKLGGLTQLELWGNKFANMLDATSSFDMSAGLSHQVSGVHLLLALLPPLGSDRVATVLCPSCWWVQVVRYPLSNYVGIWRERHLEVYASGNACVSEVDPKSQLPYVCFTTLSTPLSTPLRM